MSGWAHFRKIWLKPEVYPLIGAMGAAIGICGISMFNKTRDSIITWDKTKRGNADYFNTIDEFVPAGNISKTFSARIFGKENVIYDSHSLAHAEPPQFVTIQVGEPEEEEEAEEEPQEEAQDETKEVQADASESAETVAAVAVAVVADPVPAAPQDVVIEPVPLKDQSTENIQAALDAALNLAEESSTFPSGSASATTEGKYPTVVASTPSMEVPHQLFRGIVDTTSVPRPLTAAGLQATRLAACANGTFKFATGTSVYTVKSTTPRKRSRSDESGTSRDDDADGVKPSDVAPVTSAIADDYIIPRPFSTISTQRDIIHSAHASEVQSIVSNGVRTASVDSLGRCIVTVEAQTKCGAPACEDEAGTTTPVDVAPLCKSFTLPPVSLYSGDVGWCGAALHGSDRNSVVVAREQFRDVTVFDCATAVRTLHTVQAPTALAFAGDAALVTAEGMDLAHYDVRAGEQQGRMTRKQVGQARLQALDVSADGLTVAACGMDRIVHVFDVRRMVVRERWVNCLKYECAGVLFSKRHDGLVYVCSMDNEVACGAWRDDTAAALPGGPRSAMMSGALTRSARRAFGFRCDVRIIGMARRHSGDEEIAVVTESGAFYVLTNKGL